MLSINKIKYLKSLSQKKFRQKEKKIVLDGVKLISEAIDNNISIEHIWLQQDYENDSSKNIFFKILNKNKINFSFESTKAIKKISNTKNSQGILALISINELYNNDLNNFKDNVVILDCVSDPGNLGTIIRTCSWFGVDSLILTNNSIDIFNYKCVRSSMGGHFYIKNVTYLNYSEINTFLHAQNFNIICADMKGESINQLVSKKKWALILGSESHGINDALDYHNKFCIPSIGNIESLNVSIAAGVFLNQLMNNEK